MDEGTRVVYGHAFENSGAYCPPRPQRRIPIRLHGAIHSRPSTAKPNVASCLKRDNWKAPSSGEETCQSTISRKCAFALWQTLQSLECGGKREIRPGCGSSDFAEASNGLRMNVDVAFSEACILWHAKEKKERPYCKRVEAIRVEINNTRKGGSCRYYSRAYCGF